MPRGKDRDRTARLCRLLLVLVWSVVMPAAVSSQDTVPTGEPLHIAVFTPTSEGNTYWPEVHRVMSDAQAALNVVLTIHEFDVGDRFDKAEQGIRILQTEPVPDGAIFSVAYGQAEPLMDAAEELDIPFFLHGPLFPDELASLGDGPRRTYVHWIGYFHEDEEEKGYLLARELISAAAAAAAATDRRGPEPTIRIVGVSGDSTWYGTTLREEGLRRAVREDPHARLLQVVPTRWTQREGRTMTTRLLSRYSDVTAVWSASDQLALGAAEALRRADLQPGDDVFTGGLDLSLVGLEAVRRGSLTATVAAPTSMWARILRYLHDYLRGSDFADDVGTEILFAPEVATASSVDTILRTRVERQGR